MFEVRVQNHFSAAHKIAGHAGKCQYLHGHNWDVILTIRSQDLDHLGMAVDFADVKAILKEVIEPYDHKYLNEIAPFNSSDFNPTAENLAREIFKQTQTKLKHRAPQGNLVRVEIFETGTCSAAYYE